eukprot:TRINITY_DN1467_c0_g2_i11.p1 TRINITY_DN1467_c0_g2~~TRINITY_DN1467_c0_g2_i11.p1  ORF type:complete len:377 (-),score=67.11 TRINITY_DN1467_c0_g2_i11:289-1419(-)
MKSNPEDTPSFIAELTELIKNDLESGDLIAILDRIKVDKPDHSINKGNHEPAAVSLAGEIPPSELISATSTPPITRMPGSSLPASKERPEAPPSKNRNYGRNNIKRAKTVMNGNEDSRCVAAKKALPAYKETHDQSSSTKYVESQINSGGGRSGERQLNLNKPKKSLKLLPKFHSNKKLQINAETPSKESKEKAQQLSRELKRTFNFEEFINRQRLHDINRRQRLELLANTLTETLPAKANELPLKCVKAKNTKRSDNKLNKCGEFNTKTDLSTSSHSKNKYESKEALTPVMVKSRECRRMSSKLQIQTNLDTLIKRISEQKEHCSSKEKHRRTLEEDLQCTHRHKILSTPAYLRRNTQCNSPRTPYTPVCIKFKS